MNQLLFFANPKAQYEAHRDAIDAAIRQVLETGTYIQGSVHDSFERQFAKYVGVSDAIGVANGTDALVIAMLALGVASGDRILVPSHTASPTISAIVQAGAIPVFLDVDERSYVITPDAVDSAINNNIKAVIAVHLYGRPADALSLRTIADKADALLIEDCAQAAGARIGNRPVGSIGHAGCFSFFPTKNLGAIGDGGMVTVNDRALADRARRLRNFGWSGDRICVENGRNSRLDELQAAVLAAKLPTLDACNKRRREIAVRYRDALRELPIDLPDDTTDGGHVYHLFVIGVHDRAKLLERLKGEGIVAGIHYPVPTHRHPAFAMFADDAPLVCTERLAGRVLSLPIYPEVEWPDVERVISAIRAHYGK